MPAMADAFFAGMARSYVGHPLITNTFHRELLFRIRQFEIHV